ncbi:MAG: phosphatidate cytidylyltransferase [Candidatus Eremiobacteraeota bacterium]|nr:phosphatidate cytidylyltransferase [Candidatus Eremiobacteraeota bacterium]
MSGDEGLLSGGTYPAAQVRVRGWVDMPRRIGIGALLGVIGLASVLDARAFAALVLVIAIGCLWELDRLSARKGQELVFPVAACAVAAYIVLAELRALRRWEPELVAATVIGALAVSLFGSRSGYFARSAYTLLGVLYIGKLLSYFVALRNVPHAGLAYALAAIVLIAVSDIFAMLIGSWIGRIPLTSISPRKTWEGAVGALAATTVAGVLLATLSPLHAPWWHGALVGAITSIAAQAGDVVESALKRDARVKDAGTAMGSHGGWLDRFDSYLFGGVACYGALWVTGYLPGGPRW